MAIVNIANYLCHNLELETWIFKLLNHATNKVSLPEMRQYKS